MKMLVSTNSTLMQFLAAPTDHAAGVTIWCALDAMEKTPLGLRGIRISIDHLANGFGHERGHGLVMGSSVDTEPAEQGLGKAQGNVFVIRRFHVFQCITEICEHSSECDDPPAPAAPGSRATSA